MIPRVLEQLARDRFARYPVLTITGPRQSGKTTLCRQAFPQLAWHNLEDPGTRERALLDPRAFLLASPGGALIDEVQRAPDLLSAMQVLVDETGENSRFVLSGSHNLQLAQAISQSLAGRTTVLELLPPALDELWLFPGAPRSLDDVLLAGAYPRIHDRQLPPAEYLADYVRTYVERDVRLLTNVRDLGTFQTFLRLCAGHSGRQLNLSALASDCGISQPTAKAWLSVLETSYLVVQVKPWFRNLGKRLGKAPKLHFLDSGLCCWLLGIRTREQIEAHPLRGAVFETWVVSEILKARWNRGVAEPLHCFHELGRREVDLVVESPGRTVLVEIKVGGRVAPDATAVLDDVAARWAQHPQHAGTIERVVVYGGEVREERQGVQLLPWAQIAQFEWW
ncbi:MAG: ATP-binding protein [Planctomycetes bacterium]|nr:ATP-binding protein [Planctomycetota bacterium]